MAKQRLAQNPFQVHSEWASGGQRKLFMLLDSGGDKVVSGLEGSDSSPNEACSGKRSVISQWENRSVVSEAEDANSLPLNPFKVFNINFLSYRCSSSDRTVRRW